ncbi:MAG TPA: HAD-IA family hydrolase [Casimicrobiaceae bacterium]|jgi:phosphoglycolate phosphatase|nr:HAD-IA family hydrolase [Casimicrobiaceae bacterium]
MSFPQPLPVRAVLFDLDGTLADTAADLAAAVNRIRADRELPPLAVPLLRPHASDGTRGMLDAGLGVRRGDPEFDALKDAFLENYQSALCEHTRLFPDAERVLDEIERRGLRWGIVTNKAARFTLPLLEQLDLVRRAATIVCGDTTAQPKPHPAPLLHAAAALQLDASLCVYVGDAERDVTAARAAAMKAIVASYGYIHTDARPESWAPDGFIASLPALLDWLPPGRCQAGHAPALR